MNKKGLTLLELLAVLVVIGLISLVIIPLVTNDITGARQQINDATNVSIIEASKVYLEENIGEKIKFDETNQSFNVSLLDLINDGILNESTKTQITKNNYSLSDSFVKITRIGTSPNYIYDYELNLN